MCLTFILYSNLFIFFHKYLISEFTQHHTFCHIMTTKMNNVFSHWDSSTVVLLKVMMHNLLHVMAMLSAKISEENTYHTVILDPMSLHLLQSQSGLQMSLTTMTKLTLTQKLMIFFSTLKMKNLKMY